MAVFRTPISCSATYLVQVSARTSPREWIERVWCFPDSVLCSYYAAMTSVQLIDHLNFLRNITAGVSEYCQYWTWEGRIYNFQTIGWMARGVVLVHSLFRGEKRSKMPMLGFWESTLHCPLKFAISRYNWKPAHWHSIVFITGRCHCGCAVARQWSHPECCAYWVGQNSPDAAGGTAHATWWHYPLLFFEDSLDHFTPGSTTSILVPLTTIAQQLKAECVKLGISALLSSEVLKIHISTPRPLVVENFQEIVISSQMQNGDRKKYENMENGKSMWCNKQAGQWSNGGRIVKWRLWRKLWTKIFYRWHFLKIHALTVPIMCPTWQLQCVFFTISASEVKIPLF